MSKISAWKNKTIVIYGYGHYGKILYKLLVKNNTVFVVDDFIKDALKLQDIYTIKPDILVVAASNLKDTQEIKEKVAFLREIYALDAKDLSILDDWHIKNTAFVKKIALAYNAIKMEVLYFIGNFITFALPESTWGNLVRTNYWRNKIRFGENSKVHRGARFYNYDRQNNYTVGHNLHVGEDVFIGAGECKGIFIGNYVGIGRGSFIRSANHSFEDIDTPFVLQGHCCKSIEYCKREYSIVIEDNVWIGAHCVVLSGAKIGTGSIVAAGSVISSEIPPYSIVAGNPSRVIGNRKKKQELKEAAKHE